MNDRVANLESTVATLLSEVEGLKHRVAQLEGAGPPTLADVASPPVRVDDVVAGLPVEQGLWLSVPVLAGRSLIVLAGAFFLRALTEAGGLPLLLGVGAGMVYACIWMVAALRAATTGRLASAGTHAVCSAIIVLPLVWEATARLQVLPPVFGAVLAATFSAAGIVLAVRIRLPVAAWAFGLGGVVTEAALLGVESPGLVATAAALGLAGSVAVAADELRWTPLQWVLALGADLMVFRIVAVAVASVDPSRRTVPIGPHAAVSLALALPAVFIGVYLWRTAHRRHRTRIFDMLQIACAAALGLLGAIRIERVFDHSATWLGIVALAFGAAALAASFTVIERVPGRGRRFFFLSSLGLACVFIGVPTIFGRSVTAMIWVALAATAAVVGGRFDRISLRVHAVLYALGAAIASGALDCAVRALIPGGAARLSPLPLLPRVMVEVILVATVVLMTLDPGRMARRPRNRLPFTALVGLTTLILAGGSVAVVASAFAAIGGPDGGSLASARTMVLALSAIVVAVLGRRRYVPEAAWLVYPLLGLALLELVIGDLAQGSARTLFLSFFVCGLALIVCPWLLRSRQPDGMTGTPPAAPAD